MRLLAAVLCSVCVALLAHRGAAAQPSEPSEDTPGTSTPSSVEIVLDEPATAARDALEHNATLLDELLSESTEATIREAKFAAAAGITGGSILLGLATWRLIENEPQNAYTRGLGVMFMTLGMTDLTTGIFAATRLPHEKRRLERWEKARKGGVTDVELAHFEGELQASGETRNGERMLVRWNGLTHAIAGVLVLAFTPIPEGSSRTDRVSGYVIGGLFFGFGMATFATSFRATPSEKAWEQYSKRKMPTPGHELSWRFAPSISRRGAGLSIGGTF